MIPKPHLVVVGFDEIVVNKYLPCIARAIQNGRVDAYSVIDLESARATIERRVGRVDPRPRDVVYVPELDGLSTERQARVINSAFRRLQVPGRPTMAYIATEVRAHEAYLRHCVEHDLASLVEKPVLAPMVDGHFEPTHISKILEELLDQERRTPSRHSVMTLSRYHPIYNDRVISNLRRKMESWKAPLTSFHIRAAGGVWNRQCEYETRADHPYKYGYGMMMHGAYHYVDLATQILTLNAAIFPDAQFKLELSAFGAFPTDQYVRVSQPCSDKLSDGGRRWSNEDSALSPFGETDVASTFRLVDVSSGRTVTLGTMSFEQTTPSVRNWKEFPPDLYNKNGRTSSVDLEAQLSTLYSTHVHCYDIPGGDSPDRIDAFARVTTRANASMLPTEDYVSVETFDGLFHSDSNRMLMERWLAGTEDRSSLADHLLPMKVTEALVASLHEPGQTTDVSFS